MRKFLFSCTMLAAFGANAAADPFVSGSEPGWGKNLSPTLRRAAGYDDVRVARKYAQKPDAPTRGVPGYAFNLLTIRHGIHGADDGANGHSGKPDARYGAPPFTMSQIISEPFGVYATLQECDAARAAKIAELDARYMRFSHQVPNAQTQVTHFADGSSVTQKVGGSERTDVTFCKPGVYSPGPSFNIAQDDQTTGAATSAVPTTTLEVPPGFVKHWVAPRPFTRVVPGTSEVIEVLSASGRDLVFMVKPGVGMIISDAVTGSTEPLTSSLKTTNLLLLDDNGEVVANLRIVIPGRLDQEVHQGPDGSQVYRKDNPNYVRPKEKK